MNLTICIGVALILVAMGEKHSRDTKEQNIFLIGVLAGMFIAGGLILYFTNYTPRVEAVPPSCKTKVYL